MNPQRSPRPALRRGRELIVAIATAIGFHFGRRRRRQIAACLALSAIAVTATAAVSGAVVSHGGNHVSHPRIRWSKPTRVDNATLNDISCASKALCVAVDTLGNAVASTQPSASAWRSTAADPGVALSAVSCPSRSLCVASGGSNLVVSTDPGAGAPTWSVEAFDPTATLLSVSCPSSSLCVAVDNRGHIFSSTDPAAGASAWTSVTTPESFDLASATCSSRALCIVTGLRFGDGNFDEISRNPAAGTWKFVSRSGPTACASRAFCAAAGEGTSVRVWTKATGTPTSRRINGPRGFNNGHHLFYQVSCPSRSLCVAAGGYGYLARSYSPLHRPSTWDAHFVEGLAPGDRGFFYTVACPSTSLCVAGDRMGYLTVGSG
jgi:hypothetical protein